MIDILRALCAVSILCHSNKSWQENVNWFGDDKLKQLFNDPQAVLHHIWDRFVMKKIRRELQEAEQKRARAEYQRLAHFPVAVPEAGDAPKLNCAWWSFHINCRSVLFWNPEMGLEEFLKNVKILWKSHECPSTEMLTAFHDQMKPHFILMRTRSLRSMSFG